MPNRSSDLGLLCQPALRGKGQPRKTTVKRGPMSVVMLALIGLANPLEASAEAFGECAHQKNVDLKIASCIQAAKSTSYPWILQWVYRELARRQRERGEIQSAITSYKRSLAAEEREGIRREMEQLVLLTQ
jgi:hypothetical protein